MFQRPVKINFRILELISNIIKILVRIKVFNLTHWLYIILYEDSFYCNIVNYDTSLWFIHEHLSFSHDMGMRFSNRITHPPQLSIRQLV